MTIVVVLTLVALLIWTSEPRYDGRSLTDWAFDAQICEGLDLTDKPDYLAASNAIYQMGPAAAKTAVDWLESEERWDQFLSWTRIDRFYQQSIGTNELERSIAAAMILRLGTEEARLSVEPRLMAAVVDGGFGDRVGVLTNFSATIWPKIEPLLLHTNSMVRRHAANLALLWAGDLKVNTEILWQAWSETNRMSFRGISEVLLLRHSRETNRLAEAIGTNFLWGSDWMSSPLLSHFRRAPNLANLGPADRRYLEAGLTNEEAQIRFICGTLLRQ